MLVTLCKTEQATDKAKLIAALHTMAKKRVSSACADSTFQDYWTAPAALHTAVAGAAAPGTSSPLTSRSLSSPPSSPQSREPAATDEMDSVAAYRAVKQPLERMTLPIVQPTGSSWALPRDLSWTAVLHGQLVAVGAGSAFAWVAEHVSYGPQQSPTVQHNAGGCSAPLTPARA